MKHAIALLAAILSTNATAAIVAIIPTEESAVRLTDEDCGGGAGRLAYVRMPTGRVIAGCWLYNEEEDAIQVQYVNGEIFMYQQGSARFLQEGEKINM